ncbi:MAG: stage II sporulation protein P [Sporomusaceae bacterium]|nr:stage II sporulation protein P [Sporomusaceae bacterium]
MNRWLLTIIILLLQLLPLRVYAAENYYQIIDEGGQVVYETGWKVRKGDQVLTADNKRYEIVSITGDRAQGKYLGTTDLPQQEKTFGSWLPQWFNFSVATAEDKGKIAIYHTHTDESYVPSDGTDSIRGGGGIFQVGDSFAKALEAQGMTVIHSEAKHDPHDDMAYERSRRTAADLLKEQPDAIFDVHRDSTPPQVYQTQINGQDVTKVQLVVGQYGPTGKQIEDYALQLKSVADTKHPGLIKGIFFAKGGDYNQDLFPRSMLLEVGAHTNSKEEAERGIALFADVLPGVIAKSGANGVSGQAGVGTTTTGPSGAVKSMGIMAVVIVIGAALFLLLSTGSMKEAKAKLKQFTTTEFVNLFAAKQEKAENKAEDGKKKDE